MPKAQREGDSNTGGGVINSIPQSNTFCNGKLLSVDGSKGTGHPAGPPHAAGVWSTANGNAKVRCNGIPVNRQGDVDSCTHVRVGGSNNVNIG